MEASVVSTKNAFALYDYDPQKESELKLVEGNIITNAIEYDENWGYGRLDEAEGYFPLNYVQFLEDVLNDDHQGATPHGNISSTTYLIFSG